MIYFRLRCLIYEPPEIKCVTNSLCGYYLLNGINIIESKKLYFLFGLINSSNYVFSKLGRLVTSFWKYTTTVVIRQWYITWFLLQWSDKEWHSQHATLKKRVKPETIYNDNLPKKINSRKWQSLLLIKLIIILVPIFLHCVNSIIILWSFFIFKAFFVSKRQKLS